MGIILELQRLIPTVFGTVSTVISRAAHAAEGRCAEPTQERAVKVQSFAPLERARPPCSPDRSWHAAGLRANLVHTHTFMPCEFHRIMERFVLEGTVKTTSFQTLCHGRGHILLDQVAQGPTQPVTSCTA